MVDSSKNPHETVRRVRGPVSKGVPLGFRLPDRDQRARPRDSRGSCGRRSTPWSRASRGDACAALGGAWSPSRSRRRGSGRSRASGSSARAADRLRRARAVLRATADASTASWFDAPSHRRHDVARRERPSAAPVVLRSGPAEPARTPRSSTSACSRSCCALDPCAHRSRPSACSRCSTSRVNRLSRKVYARSLAVQEQLGDDLEPDAGEPQRDPAGQDLRAGGPGDPPGSATLCDEFRRRNLSLARVRARWSRSSASFAGLRHRARAVRRRPPRHRRPRSTFGDFVAFNAYLALLAWPTVALGWIVNVFQRGAGAMARLDEVLRAEPASRRPSRRRRRSAARRRPRVPRPDLRLRRGGRRGRALATCALTIPAGSRVAHRRPGRLREVHARPVCSRGSTRRRRARSSSAAST